MNQKGVTPDPIRLVRFQVLNRMVQELDEAQDGLYTLGGLNETYKEIGEFMTIQNALGLLYGLRERVQKEIERRVTKDLEGQ
jgi:hypothetical protein